MYRFTGNGIVSPASRLLEKGWRIIYLSMKWIIPPGARNMINKQTYFTIVFLVGLKISKQFSETRYGWWCIIEFFKLFF